MKHILSSIFIIVFLTPAFAQNKVECEKIVSAVFDAVSKQGIELIKPFLSEDFEISGQSSPIAEKVLEQLVNSLGEVRAFTLIETNSDTTLRLSYEIEYEKFGKKQSFFEFDQNNKIRKMDLLEIKIKTVEKDPSKIEYNPSNVIEIPFTRMKDLIVVKASIDGEERSFILDSGLGLTSLNSKYIGNDTTETEKNVLSTAKGVHDESLSGTNVVRTNIDFYGTRLHDQEVLTHDISHLELDDRPIYGLIGQDLLAKYDVLFDYGKNLVTLINPDYFEAYRKEKLTRHLIETLPIELRGHIPILQIKVGDDYYKMGLDCGATVNLFDIDILSKMKGNLKKITTKGLGGASKNSKDVTHAVLKKFYAGTTLYKNTKTVFSDISHLNKGKDIKLDGLLGYEFLSKQPILLSYRRKELLLIK